MSKIPTAEDILDILIPQKKFVSNQENKDSLKQNVEVLKGWVALHIEAALKSVNDNVIINDYNIHEEYCPHVDENSILNAYPLENIK
jgi:hypothetical protein